MKRNFLTGLLTGLLGALLVLGVLGAVFLYTDDHVRPDQVQPSEAKVDTITSQSLKKQDYQEIVNKLAFLQKLVDSYYLEKIDDISFEEGVYKGFISSLDDPYSVYYTVEEYKALMESSSGVYCGIGASVVQNARTGIITVVKPFKTGPAYKAGILPGDIIYKVNGKDISGKDLSEVVSLMKGKEGTKVTITVKRDDKSEPIDFVVTRKEVVVPTVEYQMLSGKIGYVIISEFDEITVEQFNAAIDHLEKQGMKGLIVDVRNNPGGLLDSVVKILDRLLPKKLIVYTLDKYNNRQEEYAEDDIKVTIPMAVLINGSSASASEIFAGTLQDYKVATLVGTTSFGKGIVQKVIPLSDGTAVKLTISKYYTPKGRNIHKTGIKPDVEVDLKEELKKEVSVPVDRDNQLQKAISEIKKQIK